MPGFVVNGVQEQVSGLNVLSWLDNPKLHLTPDDYGRRPTSWVRAITLHTTSGTVSQVLPGLGPNRDIDTKVVSYWATSKKADGSPKQAGAHIVVDVDGSIVCCADLQTEQTWHATSVNPVSIGIEIGQTTIGGQSTLYEGQLDLVVTMVDWLTRRFKIQRQIQWPYHGSSNPVHRLKSGGADVVGVYGHRDQTTDKGKGDPGDQIYQKLILAGYMPFDFAKNEDLEYWKPVQRQLKQKYDTQLPKPMTVDGVSGPTTVRAMELDGYKHGLLVIRPGD